MSEELARGHKPTIQERRLTLLRREMLEAAGLDDAMIRKAYQRLGEGLDATTQKEFVHEGYLVLGEVRPDFTERRESAKEIVKLADHVPSKLEHEVSGEIHFIFSGLNREAV